jgi:hypothetical protein
MSNQMQASSISGAASAAKDDISPQYPSLPPPARSKPWLGIIPNATNQDGDGAVFEEDGYTLAIVEFDDQGVCYNRRQMIAFATALERFQGQKPIVIVFTHGWRHDGRSDDGNLTDFRLLLKQTAIDGGGRPVFGIFVAWRGLSWCGPAPVELSSFWGRKGAALRVALGSVRELFGRLRGFREAERDAGHAPLLVIIGHSFGGLIVYSAVAQSLIEAAATQEGKIIPSFADLVLLVNPAFEAARYLPIFQQIDGRHNFAAGQPPIFVAVTAYNDLATKLAFLAGVLFTSWGQSTRRGTRERQALLKTIGHLDWMQTHELSTPSVKLRATRQPRISLWPEQIARRQRVVTGMPELDFPLGARLTLLPKRDLHNPYWVVGATPTVVDGHNGIFGRVFVDFVFHLVASHVAQQAG